MRSVHARIGERVRRARRAAAATAALDAALELDHVDRLRAARREQRGERVAAAETDHQRVARLRRQRVGPDAERHGLERQ